MRVLFITEYQPHSDDVEVTGGVEAYVHYVSGHLAKECEVEVLARRTDGSIWDAADLASLPGRLAFLAKAFVRAVRDPGDVIVATTFVVHPIGWLAAKLRRRSVVFWYPDVLIGTWRQGQFGGIAGIVGELTERLLLKLSVDQFIAISHSTARKLVAHGVPADRVAVVPCGFEPEVVAKAHEAATRVDGSIVVVARLVGYKRVDLVVRALARLRRRRPEAHLVVIGQGPERDRLQALATDLGVSDAVELRGFVPRHADVLAAIASASVFVSASEIEGFGIAVVEAMALETPYAVAAIPAYTEVTGNGVGGALFAPGDEGALTEHLDRLLGDAALRQRLGSDGKRHAAQYTWSQVATNTADVLAQTTARPRRGLFARRR